MSPIGVGVQVLLENPDSFLLCKETLTRIGIASKKDKKLYQSCHILHKRGNYFLLMFKELFILDGRPSNLTEEDIQRRNLIASLLSDWGLVSIVDPTEILNKSSIGSVKVISFKEKQDWILCSKYTIGSNK